MSGYRYTEQDLLAGSPYHYHYSPYDGPALLAGWATTRGDAVRQLTMSLQGSGDELARAILALPVPPANARRAPAPSGSCIAMMRWAAECLCTGEVPDPDWLDVFLRKFEVAKRLRRSYSADLKTGEESFAPLDAYAYLACALAMPPGGTIGLRTLNALLKLCDLVCSAAGMIDMEPAARAALLRALGREEHAVRQLAERHAVGMAV